MNAPNAAPPSPRFVFDDGAAYEQMMGRWSALVAEPFLAWLALPEGLAWLDDGCGNGAFTEALLVRQRPSSLVGVDPAPAQLAFARQRAGTQGVRFLEGDAQALPLPDACVDAAVMALVLFFLPDPAQGLRELVRVVRSGGTVAAYHWDLAGGGFPLQPILDAVHAEGHESRTPPSTWAAALEASEHLWRAAGLVEVQTRQFEVRRRFDTFEDFWRTAYGSPRLRELFASLSPPALQRLTERVRTQLDPAGREPLVLVARANAVKGRRD
ncbi:MAG: class I SAM-dependent methyltransferase [Rubrivivax sp.]|nr:class I SAM-dependent methyltransferase [Rubrivivax sp.]